MSSVVEDTNKDIDQWRRERNGKRDKKEKRKKPDCRSILYDQKLNKAYYFPENRTVKDCLPQLLDAIHM